MSNLLEQASLVMIPSGYKEDVVYSEIPLNGAGDLSFTRASSGTRINSAGLVEVCPWNLLQQSENYSVSPWNRSYITVTPNDIVAPNGTTTGNKIVLNNSGSQRYQLQQGVTTNTSLPMTFTFYAKKNQIDTFVGVIGGASGMSYEVQFNLTNGTATEVYNSSGINTAKSIENVGNGWYKCTITAGSSSGLITGVNIFKDTTGNAVDSFYIWGTQFNFGSTAKPYFPTTDRLNVPRLTYQNGGGGCPSLLLEKQSTNSLNYSEQLDNALWSKGPNVSITANSIISPDGTQNADTSTNSGASAVYVYQLSNNASLTWTASLYAKKGTNKYVGISICAQSYTNDRYQPVFNLDDGTIQAQNSSGSNMTNTSCSIIPMGNGWYRITATGTFALGSDNCFIVIQSTNNTNYQPDTAGGSLDWANATNGNCYLWGAQLEASSYATSYIPTTSSSATRVADACYKTGISSLIGQTSGALFVEFNSSFLESYTQRIFTLSDGTTNNVIGFQLTGANQLVFYVEYGGSNQVVISTSTPAITLGSNVKIAAAYANNDFVFYVNGTQIGTDTSGSVPATSQLRFSEANASTFYLGLIKQVCLFPTRLTNAELASLTTL